LCHVVEVSEQIVRQTTRTWPWSPYSQHQWTVLDGD